MIIRQTVGESNKMTEASCENKNEKRTKNKKNYTPG